MGEGDCTCATVNPTPPTIDICLAPHTRHHHGERGANPLEPPQGGPLCDDETFELRIVTHLLFRSNATLGSSLWG
jgi:hypothetical protein